MKILNDSKHAFCICAHKNWHQLQTLIYLLDEKNNDIYIHVDNKSYVDFLNSGGVISKYSKLVVFSEFEIFWSHISQMYAELSLYKKVIDSGVLYRRVHLLSGQDLPLITNEEIHNFFDSRQDEEFLYFSPSPWLMKKRIMYYHFFVKKRTSKIFDLLRKVLVGVQTLIRVDRLNRTGLKFAVGQNWCSLTLDAVREILLCDERYRGLFHYTTSPEECYKQMYLVNAKMKYTFSEESQTRYFSWNKGAPSPNVLTMADYENMIKSGKIFARKFDEYVDSKIINEIASRLS